MKYASIMGLQHDYSTMIKLCDFCKVALTHETNRSTSGHGLGLVTRGLVNITGVVTCGLILVLLHEVSLTSLATSSKTVYHAPS